MGIDYFFASNDSLHVPTLETHRETRLIGFATLHTLHVLAILSEHRSPSRVIIIDKNPGQLKHFAMLRSDLLESKDHVEFIRRTLCADTPSPEFIAVVNQACKIRRDKALVTGTQSCRRDLPVERALWARLDINTGMFRERYRENPIITRDGLVLDSVILGHPVRQLVQVFACYSGDPSFPPFTLGLGTGILADERAFRRSANAAAACAWEFHCGSIENYTHLIDGNGRTSTLVCQISNIFQDPSIWGGEELRSMARYFAAIKQGMHRDLNIVILEDTQGADHSVTHAVPRRRRP